MSSGCQCREHSCRRRRSIPTRLSEICERHSSLLSELLNRSSFPYVGPALEASRLMRLPLSALFLSIAMSLTLGLGSAVAEPRDMLSVTVRIHDYVGIPTACMTSAQENVKDLYAAIGVNTIWAETKQPGQVAGTGGEIHSRRAPDQHRHPGDVTPNGRR